MTNEQIIQATKELNELLKSYTELQTLYKQMCFVQTLPKERVEKVLLKIEEAIAKIVDRMDEMPSVHIAGVPIEEFVVEKRRKMRL